MHLDYTLSFIEVPLLHCWTR